MTPEAMRIAIAESEGWKLFVNLKGWSKEMSFDSYPVPIPNYPEDLNAILPLLPISVQIHLWTNGWSVYCWIKDVPFQGKDQSLALAACEFYLKWKGLWKE